MKGKKIIYIALVAVLLLVSIVGIKTFNKKEKSTVKTKKMEAMVLSSDDKEVMVQDSNHIIYTFSNQDIDAKVGSNIVIEYTGLLDKMETTQKTSILNYRVKDVVTDEDGIPVDYLDNGIFSDYYILAHNKLKELTLDEKISQILLVRYPDSNQKEILKKYQFGGYVFFAKDFANKSKSEVIDMMKSLQDVAKVPILTAVDEEGGKVVRISSNPKLRSEKFLSSRELYQLGGMNKIKDDTIEKSTLLKELGLNVNLAPVVDVSTNSSDYMYERTIGENTDITSEFAKTVIKASKGKEVSYTLKHFPGYGNNRDTHTGSSTDNRTLDDIKKNDLPPFKAGIDEGAEAVLVSHNTVSSIDSSNPASLSPSVHNLLRNDLGFTGVIMTDDLAMGATSSIDDAVVKAILAGNDLLIVTDYEESFNKIKKAIEDGTISEEQINKLAFRVLAWKYYKGIMFGIHK